MGFDRGLMEADSASHQGRGALVHKKNRFPPRARSRFTEPLFFIYIYRDIFRYIYIYAALYVTTHVYIYICVYTIERKQSEVVLVSQSESSEGCNL